MVITTGVFSPFRKHSVSVSSNGPHLLFALSLASRLEVSQARFDGTFQRVDFVLFVQERFQFLLHANGQRELIRNRLSGRYRRLPWRCRRFWWRIDWRRVRLEIGYIILNANTTKSLDTTRRVKSIAIENRNRSTVRHRSISHPCTHVLPTPVFE